MEDEDTYPATLPILPEQIHAARAHPVRIWLADYGAAILVGVAVISATVEGIRLAIAGELPGYQHPEDGGVALWGTFWATILVGGIVAVVAGIVLFVVQDATFQRRERARMRREIAVVRERLYFAFLKIAFPIFTGADSRIFNEIHEAAAVLQDVPLSEWRTKLSEEHEFWDCLDHFIRAYRDCKWKGNALEHLIRGCLIANHVNPESTLEGEHSRDNFIILSRCISQLVPARVLLLYKEAHEVALHAPAKPVAKSRTVDPATTAMAIVRNDELIKEAAEKFRKAHDLMTIATAELRAYLGFATPEYSHIAPPTTESTSPESSNATAEA